MLNKKEIYKKHMLVTRKTKTKHRFIGLFESDEIKRINKEIYDSIEEAAQEGEILKSLWEEWIIVDNEIWNAKKLNSYFTRWSSIKKRVNKILNG